MRKLTFVVGVLVGVMAGCESKAPTGPGVVTITESTTSTTTTTTTTTTIAVPTVASFVFSPLTPEVLQMVFFNAAASTAGSDRTIVSYAWDFGDGVLKSGVTATHDFFPTGVYLVTLTVTDDRGQKFMSSQPVTVRPVVP